MRIGLWLNLFCWAALPGRAENTPQKPDTNTVNHLLARGEAIETRNIEAAIQLYRQAHALARKLGFTKGYFNGMRLLCYTLNNSGRYEEARTIALEGLQEARKDTSKRNLGLSHFALANAAMAGGDLKEATRQFHQAAHYMRLLNHRQNLAVIYNNLGILYQNQDLYKQAIEQYEKALRIHQEAKDADRDIAITLFNMGVTYGHMHDRKRCIDYYKRARQYIDPKTDLDFLVTLYNNIGYEFGAQARYDSALHYQREGLRLSRKLGNVRHEMHLLMTLGQTYNLLGQYGQAKSHLDASYGIARKTNAGLTELRNIYREYSVLYEKTGNYKAAYEWSEKYYAVHDSLENTEAKELLQSYEEKIKKAEARQNLLAKQRQIERLEAERKQQNLWMWLAIISAVAIAAVLLISVLLYRQRQRATASALLALQREQELVAMRAEMEGQQKERLRISREMHDDLGASLTAIGLLSEVMKTRLLTAASPEIHKISELSSEMVTAMNEIIWSLNTRNDSLNGLIAYLRSYAREFAENTSLSLKIDAEEAPEDINIPGDDRRHIFLTVKEALNNVVKHAQAERVTLRMLPRQQQLFIEVCDNGRGFVQQDAPRHRNGLKNMQNRMQTAGGECTITSSDEGTCVRITYPYAPESVDKILQM